MDIIYIAAAVIVGLLLGSFVNALANRYILGEVEKQELNEKEIDGEDDQDSPRKLEPVVSSYRRTLVISAIVASVFALVTSKILALPLDTVPTVIAIIALWLFAIGGVVLSLIDARTLILPSRLIYAVMLVSVSLLSLSALIEGDYSRLLWMVVGSLGSAGIYFTVWFIKPGSLGFGDVRLSLLTGAILGWISLGTAIVGFALPFFMFAFTAGILSLLKRIDTKTQYPMGPWIIAGAVIAIQFGDILVEKYLSIGGFV